MRTLLFGIEPIDVPSFAASSALLLTVALAACLIPARRAAASDPSVSQLSRRSASGGRTGRIDRRMRVLAIAAALSAVAVHAAPADGTRAVRRRLAPQFAPFSTSTCAAAP